MSAYVFSVGRRCPIVLVCQGPEGVEYQVRLPNNRLRWVAARDCFRWS